jgi:hypothetical protein
LKQEYEYKFVRLGEGLMSVSKEARKAYKDVIREHAVEGWRLVQIFAPPIGGAGAGTAKYFEIILERRVSGD